LYKQKLCEYSSIILPDVSPDTSHSYHLFVIRHESRDLLQQYLKDNGIGTLIHYPIPPHLQKAYSYLGYREGDFPIAETLSKTNLSLPLWPGMTEEYVNYICEKIHEFECTKNR
jgi:dTDP-4-amino-4,6-dideoxygalactose transaminase